jgi:hypothetical protein
VPSRRLAVVACATLSSIALGCGRLEYAGLDADAADAASRADAADGSDTADASTETVFSPAVVGWRSCDGIGSTTLTLERAVAPGETLFVALFQREPGADRLSTIADAAGNAWSLDASFVNVGFGTLTHHAELFRTVVTTPLAVDDTVTVTHRDAGVSAIVAWTTPSIAALAGATSTFFGEDRRPVSSPTALGGDATVCMIVHANPPALSYDSGWVPVLGVIASCGEARSTLGGHVSVHLGAGTLTCGATVATDTVWTLGLAPYVGLLPP